MGDQDYRFGAAPAGHDPYDIWMTHVGVAARRRFYRGSMSGTLLAAGLGTLDWLFPEAWRRIAGVKPRAYPITIAQWILQQDVQQEHCHDPQRLFADLVSTAAWDGPDRIAWGLGFPWMSKNGLYDETTPFITHTPYAMEALLHLSNYPDVRQEALETFDRTLGFLDALLVMKDDGESLAVSYAPLPEPRIVVNANAYASYAYAMHYQRDTSRSDISDRARKLARWVVSQQHENGAWYYYADDSPGNFIDCFHSCFIIKNLRKAGKMVEGLGQECANAIHKGTSYIEDAFYDKRHGLVRRFTERHIMDPYVWDLYDQAEYLGLLIDCEQYQTASEFVRHLAATFMKNGEWYCRKDFIGRLWGRNHYRWGIMPLLYQMHRLRQLHVDALEAC